MSLSKQRILQDKRVTRHFYALIQDETNPIALKRN